MASVQRLKSASDRHTSQRDGILEQLLKLLLGLWGGYDRWDDPVATAGMVARTSTIVSSAVARSRRAQRSYLTAVLADYGIDTRPAPKVVDSYPRANAAATEVYRRPVDQFIWRRRNGGTMAESEEAFRDRIRAIAEADILAAEREESLLVYDALPDVIGHRRVIHPELSRTGTCGLCVVAANQWYTTGELMPIHLECNCDSAPIARGSDPGLALNKDDLEEIYAAAGGTSAEALKNTRVAIRQHGELGPILVRDGQHFKTPEEAGKPPFVRQTPALKRAATELELEQTRATLETARSSYAAYVEANPSTLIPNSPNQGERIALFRAVKYLQEYSQVLESRLTALTE